MADLVMGRTEGFNTEALQSRLVGRRMGWRIHYFPVVDSTNRVALALLQDGAAEGTVVLADCQTRGKGRLQRTWQSPPGCNLYASLILRPAMSPAEVARITLTAGVAIAEMISGFCEEGVELKWPNDVLIRERKVCGILTEMRTTGKVLDGLVVGIGLNVNIARRDFAPEYRNAATSLWEETGKIFPLEEVAFFMCEFVEKWYHILLSKGFGQVREQWLAWSQMVGRRARVLFQDEVREGRVVGIDHDGALLLEDPQGSLQRIVAGDASIVKG